MHARLDQAKVGEFDGYVLENDAIRIVVVPELGGKIVSLQSRRTDREWLWRNPHLSLQRPPIDVCDFGPYDCGGWDEIFPTVTACSAPHTRWGDRRLTDHGELWYRPWRILAAECTSEGETRLTLAVEDVALPFRFVRTLSLRSGSAPLLASYELSRLCDGPLPYIWAAHPLLRVQPGDKIILPLGTQMTSTGSVNIDVGPQPLRFIWPDLILANGTVVDLSVVGHPTSNFAIKLFAEDLPSGSIEVIDSAGRQRISFHWKPAEIPHVGLWLNYGAWSGTGTAPYFNVGIEPTSCPHDDLSTVLKSDCASELAATTSWMFEVSFGARQE